MAVSEKLKKCLKLNQLIIKKVELMKKKHRKCPRERPIKINFNTSKGSSSGSASINVWR